MEEIKFVPAKESEAAELSALRQKVWATTYRGIYRDEDIDNYDFRLHEEKDLFRIRSVDFSVFFITFGGEKIGYLILQNEIPLYIQSLYLLEGYRRKGIGTAAFEFIRSVCAKRGEDSFYCHCNPENEKALAFYKKMGGTITSYNIGHENHMENSVRIEFMGMNS